MAEGENNWLRVCENCKDHDNCSRCICENCPLENKCPKRLGWYREHKKFRTTWSVIKCQNCDEKHHFYLIFCNYECVTCGIYSLKNESECKNKVPIYESIEDSEYKDSILKSVKEFDFDSAYEMYQTNVSPDNRGYDLIRLITSKIMDNDIV